jgi:hypothetical protein
MPVVEPSNAFLIRLAKLFLKGYSPGSTWLIEA